MEDADPPPLSGARPSAQRFEEYQAEMQSIAKAMTEAKERINMGFQIDDLVACQEVEVAHQVLQEIAGRRRAANLKLRNFDPELYCKEKNEAERQVKAQCAAETRPAKKKKRHQARRESGHRWKMVMEEKQRQLLEDRGFEMEVKDSLRRSHRLEVLRKASLEPGSEEFKKRVKREARRAFLKARNKKPSTHYSQCKSCFIMLTNQILIITANNNDDNLPDFFANLALRPLDAQERERPATTNDDAVMGGDAKPMFSTALAHRPFGVLPLKVQAGTDSNMMNT